MRRVEWLNREMILAAANSLWVRAISGICILLITVCSLIPQSERVGTGLPGKHEHFIAYSVTGFFLGLSIHARNGPLLAAAILSWLACVLEFLQQWAPGRHPRVSDAIVSAAAAMIGAAVAARLRKWVEVPLVWRGKGVT
jgi:VanZ family protein